MTIVEAEMPVLKVVEFVAAPGGRFRSDGPNSGEAFRDDVLAPCLDQAIATGQRLVVELDGTPGYPSSFLEETFGGLVRLGRFSWADLTQFLHIEARTKRYAPYAILVQRHMEAARRVKVAA